MPLVRVISENKIIEDNVSENTNLVVQAGIKKFPYPYLKYKCGMGTCGTCASLIISGKKNLPEPTWKEVKVLKEKLDLGYRLACQFTISHDIEIKQDWLFYLIKIYICMKISISSRITEQSDNKEKSFLSLDSFVKMASKNKWNFGCDFGGQQGGSTAFPGVGPAECAGPWGG